MRHCISIFILLFLFFSTQVYSQNIKDTRTREYLTPTRIIWTSENDEAKITNPNQLLKKGIGQSFLGTGEVCTMTSTATSQASILVDFGKEFHGGLRFVTGQSAGNKPIKIRVRFGESVSEAMSEIGEKGSMNDHAMRDFEMSLPWLGVAETGHSGFRFARIDLLDTDVTLILREIIGVYVYRDIPYLGSFKSNDERLNKIWETGAYTVHLNMQEYLWDGIKRDRLVWLGDLHPEVMTINYVFGYNDVVPKSLDLARETTPLPGWMSGISSYSLWWIIIHKDWYRYHADMDYLREQKTYLTELLNILLTKVDKNGKEQMDESRFLDWPSNANPEGIAAGLQGLLFMALESGSYLCDILGDKDLAQKCQQTANRMKKYIPDPNNSKQAAAILSLSGLEKPKKMNKEITKNGVKNFSTFYGYYMLGAMAKAGDYQTAIEYIKTYWGAMLDMGATTFWEDFDIDWIQNAGRIDELVPEGKVDIHADYGNYCYVGLRHSLCHGWASGPTAWLNEHVLGVQVIEPGCATIKIEPHLGDLEWVEGTFPTPKGVVKIQHKKVNGKIQTNIDAPDGIKIIR